MRAILSLLIILAPMAQSAMAEETYADPKALVQAIYDGYKPGAAKGDPTVHYSERLKGIAQLAADTGTGATPALSSELEPVADPNFNPFLPDDNALLFDLVISEPMRLDDRAVVTVTYHNFDQPRLLSVSLVEESGIWKVDDVASLGSEVPWLLSWALAADPYAM
ncbi:hypothetical protein [Devosia sp. Leaf420]|uniref:hypothetical protein n=1 Tax=Devosia sp. Leaf420 TaxID=1736374 RepID=UPI000B2A84A7|nr:hypothetical protein [Devosia sp. Leaf420]